MRLLVCYIRILKDVRILMSKLYKINLYTNIKRNSKCQYL